MSRKQLSICDFGVAIALSKLPLADNIFEIAHINDIIEVLEIKELRHLLSILLRFKVALIEALNQVH